MEYIDFLRDMVEYKLEIDGEECVLRVFKFDTKKIPVHIKDSLPLILMYMLLNDT